MSDAAFDGRDRASAEGPYARQFGPGARPGRRRRVDPGPDLWDLPRPEVVAEHPAPIFPLLGATTLLLRSGGIDFFVEPIAVGEEATGRGWRVWHPGIEAVTVVELDDPEAVEVADPGLRGLWCSCNRFAEAGDCGHLRDLVQVGLLRPDRSEWGDCPLAEDCPLAIEVRSGKGGAR